MLFEALQESVARGELLLSEGLFCRFHLRRDGQLTIQEIIVLPSHRRKGLASQTIDLLSRRNRVKNLLARCPADLESNQFWKAKGFQLQAVETAKSGRKINVWILPL